MNLVRRALASTALITAVVAYALVGSAQENRSSAQPVAEREKPPRYTIVDLGTLGGSSSGAGGLNNRGRVAGTSLLAGDRINHEFLWRDGKMTDVGSGFGPLISNAPEDGPVNDFGAVSGYVDSSMPDPNGEDFCGFGDHNICLPFVWRDGTATVLPLPGGNNGLPNQINDRGEIVGWGEAGNPDPTCVPPQVLDGVAAIWGPRKDELRELPAYGDDTEAYAFGINEKGEVVGTSGKCKFLAQSLGYIEAILWRDGRPIDLGSLGYRLFNIGFSINNKSEVTGQASTPRTCCGGFHLFHAYLWRDGVMKDLGTLSGDPFSLGNSINDKSQIVGLSETPSSVRAFLWQNGTMYNVNTLIPRHSGFNVLEALGINDRGQIAGYGFPRSASALHGFLATPCDAQNPDQEGCQDARGTSTLRVLPNDVRRMLLRRHALQGIFWPTQARP